MSLDRRVFLGAVLAGVASGAVTRAEAAGRLDAVPIRYERPSPTEGLMRGHAVVERLLAVYDAGIAVARSGAVVSPGALRGAAWLVHEFMDAFHDRMEERWLFPRFERAGQHVELVARLRTQHDRGREITDAILAQTLGPHAAQPASQEALAAACARFVRMFRPHAAHEDTVLFPALRAITSGAEYDDLAEGLADEAGRRFGEHGFAQVLERVAELEAQLGLADLAVFSPGA